MNLHRLSWLFNLAVAIVLAGAACAPAAAPAPDSAQKAEPPAALSEQTKAELDQLLAAAKREGGSITIVAHPAAQWSGWIPVFQKRFPDLKVEFLGLRPSQATPRILSEQKNGLYALDVMVGPTSNVVSNLSPVGVFQAFPPFVQLEEVKQASKWYGGYEMWAEENDKFSFITNMTVARTIVVNRKLLPKADFSKPEDLTGAKAKGKMVIYNPRNANNGSLSIASLMKDKGEEFVRPILSDAVYVDSPEQVSDFVASGRYAIGIGAESETIEKLQAEGLAKDVEVMTFAEIGQASGIGVFTNAPHPAAAKLLVNWFLTQEGQEAVAREGATISRRTDVKPYIGESAFFAVPDWNNLNKYLRVNEWSGVPMVKKATDLAKSIKP
jgi:iron(III) transport system substrate-binding protein